jgi:hypothetical protein
MGAGATLQSRPSPSGEPATAIAGGDSGLGGHAPVAGDVAPRMSRVCLGGILPGRMPGRGDAAARGDLPTAPLRRKIPGTGGG